MIFHTDLAAFQTKVSGHRVALLNPGKLVLLQFAEGQSQGKGALYDTLTLGVGENDRTMRYSTLNSLTDTSLVQQLGQ